MLSAIPNKTDVTQVVQGFAQLESVRRIGASAEAASFR